MVPGSNPGVASFGVKQSQASIFAVYNLIYNYTCLTPKEATPGFEPGTIQVYTGGVNHYTI